MITHTLTPEQEKMVLELGNKHRCFLFKIDPNERIFSFTLSTLVHFAADLIAAVTQEKDAEIARLIYDIRHMTNSANAEARLVDELSARADHLQAKIDSLMLEYCPDEMTAEQIAVWASHQKPAYEMICKSCGVDRLKDDCTGDRVNCSLRGKAQSDMLKQSTDAGNVSKNVAEIDTSQERVQESVESMHKGAGHD